MNIIILTGTSDHAFHVREISANNIIHVTESLAVCQTRQNTYLVFESVRRVCVNISEGKIFENMVTDVHASMLKIK